ncbi:hypothetical protein DL764_001493 [Monosporascus ibericus]|uniref:Uncharacterized protein n=1 Tax=Monosporascus ibericus TaxID=155417 RepID=A0A4Q4TQY9_9PEZI|nr:hypothetical protein DL764_001493 [Monosporascus ibericus]
MKSVLYCRPLARKAMLPALTPSLGRVVAASRFSTASARLQATPAPMPSQSTTDSAASPPAFTSAGLDPYRPGFFNALDRIMKLRKKYAEHRHLFVPGEEMHEVLKSIGATDEDFERLRQVSNHLGKDPTLPFREIKQGRIVYDFGADKAIYRTEKQPFILSKDEGFKRHDSDSLREFPEVADDLQQNSVLHALLRFKTFFIQDLEIAKRPAQDYTSDKWICTLFNVRTFTSDDVLGEPALEGVHSDGVDHTMVTLLGHDNMTDESAITLIHDMREEVGIPIDQTKGPLVKGVAQHWDFLDTVLIVDSERFHSLTPVRRIDESRRSTRDVLIFFTRKPALEGHASYGVDSTVRHKTLPMRIPVS